MNLYSQRLAPGQALFWLIELVLSVGPIFNDCELDTSVFLSDKLMFLPDCTFVFCLLKVMSSVVF